MEIADPEGVQSLGMPSEVAVAIHLLEIEADCRSTVIQCDGPSAHWSLALALLLAQEFALDQFRQTDLLELQIQVASAMGLRLLEVPPSTIEEVEAHSIALERSASGAS